jgi:hypothetical protein
VRGRVGITGELGLGVQGGLDIVVQRPTLDVRSILDGAFDKLVG